MPKTESPDETKDSKHDDIEPSTPQEPPREYGGPKGREPTRFGDWEKNGRCIDF